jgi:hypothetical protein
MRKKIWINVAIILWAIAAGIFASIKPWQVYQKQNEETRMRSKEMRDAETHRDDLLRKEARAHSTIGQEELARKAGYLGPGEVASDTPKK